jgi:hypothetical protein
MCPIAASGTEWKLAANLPKWGISLRQGSWGVAIVSRSAETHGRLIYVLPGGILAGSGPRILALRTPCRTDAHMTARCISLEALTLDPFPCHLDELERQMKVAMIILNPTFLVFIQLVAT